MSLRWLALWLVVGALCWVAIIDAATFVVRVAASDPAPWSPPPSAIRPLDSETNHDTRWPTPGLPARTLGQDPDRSGDAAQSSLRPSLVDAVPVPAPPQPTQPLARPAQPLAELTFVGVASTYGPGWDPRLVALPQGPGWRFRVCGQGGCLVLVSTDKGPDQRLFPGRVVDLPVWAFERVSGQPWTRGITTVSVVILGRKP